jgi:hypothetical protein
VVMLFSLIFGTEASIANSISGIWDLGAI